MPVGLRPRLVMQMLELQIQPCAAKEVQESVTISYWHVSMMNWRSSPVWLTGRGTPFLKTSAMVQPSAASAESPRLATLSRTESRCRYTMNPGMQQCSS